MAASGDPKHRKDATRIAHTGRPAEDGPVNPPIERASTFVYANSGTLYGKGRRYGRMGVTVHDALGETLSAIQGAARTLITSSGLSACVAPFRACAQPGSHVLVTDSIYGPTRDFASRFLGKERNVEVEFYDPRIGAGIADLIREETALIALESPGSLTFEVQDVPAITAAARARGVKTMIDDTWSAGLLSKPIDLGVDMACQALTKYVSGGSDVFGGAICCADEKTAAQIEGVIRISGESVSPDSAALALRGLRSLAARLKWHGEAGLKVAQFLEGRPEIVRLIHPALPSHPDHEIWKRDFNGTAGLFGAILKPASDEAVNAFIDALELFGCGFSWGGFESLAIHCDPQIQRTAVPWTAEGPLVRFQIGLEDPDDLITDLEQGIRKLKSS